MVQRVIDLRQGKRPPSGQIPLFSPRPPRAPEPPPRPMPLRARRRRVRALIVFGALVLVAGLLYGVSYVSYLPQFNISSISVSGARGISDELIRGSVETVLDDGSYHILSRRNVLLYPRAAMEQEVVKSFPLIKSARIAHSSLLSTSITVEVEERQPFARWCATAESDCYFMDDGGFIYAPADAQATSSTRYVFSGGIASSSAPLGQSFVRAHLSGVLSLLKFLGQAGFTPQGAHVEGEQDILVPLQEGFLLKASFGADAGTLVKNLQLVLASDVLQGKRSSLEYVDLRFGNRVYYKLKGQEQQSAQ